MDDAEEYKKNPLYNQHEYGNFSPFYVTITICTVIGFFLIVINAFFCWCSSHRDYWIDSNTGNRWISSIWVRTPYKQPPLDISELESQAQEVREVYETRVSEHEEQFELHKRESDL